MHLVLLIFFIFVAFTVYAASRSAPWVPTRRKDIERFLNFVEMKPGEKFYELGCGDARLSIAAVKKYGVQAIGVELSVPQVIAALIRNWLAKTHVKIKWANLFEVDFFEADIVYLFLMPEIYAKIKPKLERELKPGARVVSYVWPIVGWKPQKIDQIDGKLKLYLYEIGDF
jgi:SAM-dependent methyltransferase